MLHSSFTPPSDSESLPCLKRRRFLRNSLIMAGALVSAPVVATTSKTGGGEKRIEFHNLHTNEREKILYWSSGEFQQGGLSDLNNILRDHRTGDVYDMDAGLIDFLYDLDLQLGGKKRFEVISGYRSPKTNSALRNNSSGVAKRSLHMQGKAIDIRVPGVALKDLRHTALTMKRGGVGFYPKSNFIHVDTGRVRSWG